MLHHIYYINANGADNYMIVPFDEIDLTVAFLESLDHEVVAYWPIEEEAQTWEQYYSYSSVSGWFATQQTVQTSSIIQTVTIPTKGNKHDNSNLED